MENISKIRTISIWIFIIPVVTINLCLFISLNGHLLAHTIFQADPIGQSGFTIPYIDGGTSISRSARTYPAFLIFKPGMIITAFLLIKYWIANNKLIKKINNNDDRKNNIFLIFGVGSAIFLIIHSILLGVSYDIDLYKFMRRFVLLGFIIFEIVAQTLLVLNIIKVKDRIKDLINSKILIIKAILVSVMIIVAILVSPILNSSDYTHFKHALEWNYFLAIVSFYLLTYFFWKKR